MKKMLMALSLTGALLGGTAAWAEETVTTPTSEVTATSTSEAPATIAAAPAAEETPVLRHRLQNSIPVIHLGF
ncbi:hypothetical protein AB3515_18325 [Acinetobacter baumannii]